MVQQKLAFELLHFVQRLLRFKATIPCEKGVSQKTTLNCSFLIHVFLFPKVYVRYPQRSPMHGHQAQSDLHSS